MQSVVVLVNRHDRRLSVNDDGATPRLAQRHDGVGNDELHRMRPSRRVGEISKTKRRSICVRIENSIYHRTLLIVSHSNRGAAGGGTWTKTTPRGDRHGLRSLPER
jgi:hypothetical protein